MTIHVMNKMTTPDGTCLISMHRHDYNAHKDNNGELYFIDGETEYIRTSFNNTSAKIEPLYLESDFEEIRYYIQWGTYGKDGNQPYKKKSLCDLDTDHIKAILKTQLQISNVLRACFKEELKYRGELDEK